MKTSLAGPRYAHALFHLAENSHQTERVEEDLLGVRQIMEKNGQIAQFISSSAIARGEKESFIDRIFATGCSKLTLDFLKVLIKKKRFSEFPFIQNAYHRLFEKKILVQEVVSITAIPLSKTNEEKLIAFLKEKLRSNIRLIKKRDPKILGGLILRFNEMEIDGSFSSHLKKIRQCLLSSYEGN